MRGYAWILGVLVVSPLLGVGQGAPDTGSVFGVANDAAGVNVETPRPRQPNGPGCGAGSGCFDIPEVVDEAGDVMHGQLTLEAPLLIYPGPLPQTESLDSFSNQIILENDTRMFLAEQANLSLDDHSWINPSGAQFGFPLSMHANLSMENGTQLRIRAGANLTLEGGGQILAQGGIGLIGTTGQNPFTIVTNNTAAIEVGGAGNVGINITNASERLVVNGNVAPGTNDTWTLGTTSLRWAQLFLGSEIDYTSDLEYISGGVTHMTLTTSGALLLPGALAAGAFSGSGAGLSGVIAAGLADGVVTSSKLAAGAVQPQHLASAGCQANEVLAWNGAAWACTAVGGGSLPGGTYADSFAFTNVSNTFLGQGGGLAALNATNLTAGTLPGARLSGTYANTVAFSNASNAFTGSGAGLTNLDASDLATGTVPSARVAGTYSNALTLSSASNSFTGSGAGLTNLDASDLATGTVPSARVSGTYSNAVTLSNAANSFAGSGAGLTGVSAATLNGVSEPSLLRSDATDTFTGSQLIIGGSSVLDVEGLLRIGPASSTDDDLIMFDDASEYLAWNNTRGRFVVSDGLQVNGSADSSIHMSATAQFGQAAGFQPGSGGPGLLLEGRSGGEGAGLFLNGDTAAIWSPGDGNLLSVYDEDFMPGGAPAFAVDSAGSIKVGARSSSDTDSIYFDDGASEHIRWNNALGQFEVSDDLQVERLSMASKILEVVGGVLRFDGNGVCTTSGNCGTGVRLVAPNDIRLGTYTPSSSAPAGAIAGSTGPDVTPILQSLGFAAICYTDANANAAWDAGEGLYLNIDADTCAGEAVEMGDLRLVAVGGSGAFTRVTGSSADFGNPLTDGGDTGLLDGGLELSRYDADGNGFFNAGDTMYADVDGSSTVSAGDYRWTPYGANAAGTRVAGGNTDIGNFLTSTMELDPAIAYWDANPNAALDVVDILYIDVSQG